MTKLIDLSHPLEHGQYNFPDDPEIAVVVYNTVARIGYNISQLSMSSHQGTHLDAPFHFFDDGKTVDEMDLEHFYGPAVLVDLAPGGALPAHSELTLEMVRAHAGDFQPGARVVLRTGWEHAFGTREFFSDFPSLTLDATRWIAEQRIRMLGMDMPTPSRDWLECHHILLARGVEIVIVEALANLDQLPRRFTFLGFPLKIKGRDGSPIRAIAIVD